MNINKVLIVLVTILIVGGGTIFAIQSQTKDMMKATDKTESERLDEKMTNEMSKDEMSKDEMNKDDAMQDKMMDEVKGGEMMDKKESIPVDDMMDQKDEMMSKGSYEAYAPEKIAMAETGDVVLFFHASWCPSCRSLNTSIEENMMSIPKGVTILKTDYDKETGLKKKYGVTTQHTNLKVDKDGNLIKKWSGSPSIDSVISQIQ